MCRSNLILLSNMLDELIISQSLLEKYRQELIPNFHNIDKLVQDELGATLNKIITCANDTEKLNQISRKNVLEQAPLLRSHLWKLLLGALDRDYSTWAKTRKKNADLYKALKEKFFSTYVDEDDLLGLGSKSFDQNLWDQIQLDTKRTHTNLNFFQAKCPFGKVYASKPTKHCNMLTRILYIWGKTNSTVRYVQGMNQILAPIYFLEFQSLECLNWDRQSQVFFLFSALMSFVIDMHIKQMDQCESGIMGRMVSLNRYLRVVDGQLWQKMEEEKIYPQYYSFRWLALFLAQEFGLQETIRLWDFIFSFDGYNRFFFVYCLCISILLTRKKQIMQNDFITSLPLIQKLKDLDIENLIKMATKLYNKHKKLDINQKFLELTSNNAKQQQLIKQQRKHIIQKSWSYAQVLKSTGSYLVKWTNWSQKDSRKSN